MPGILVIAQVFLRRHTNRDLNAGLVAATVLAAALVVWTLFALSTQSDRATRAQKQANEFDLDRVRRCLETARRYVRE